MSTSHSIPDSEKSERSILTSLQTARLEELLSKIYKLNQFYTRKLDDAGINPDTVKTSGSDLNTILNKLPFTTKAELVTDQEANQPWGTTLTEPIEHYTRHHQTSGTTGEPLKWLDTNESWQWALECWKAVYRGAHVGSKDRIVFAFSFGPFFGFWTAFEAAGQIGAYCVPAGGMSSSQRVALIEAVNATVICCTPTYALRLAQVGHETGGQPLANGSVKLLIVAGEPGGSIPATRQRIEQAWGARVFDHHGLTEVGPISFECWDNPGFLHLNETEYICEVLDPKTLKPVTDGEAGELIVTNLGRAANPVIRYRTGDIVIRQSKICSCGRTLARLEGGVLGRADDMLSIRGVNVYPTAVESILRRFKEIIEFRSTVSFDGTLALLSIEIEIMPSMDSRQIVGRVERSLREGLGLTVPVLIVEPGSLPRFEMKAHRFIVENGNP